MTVKQTKDTITPSIAKMRQALKELPGKAYQEWLKNTPIDTGNARRKTRLRGTVIEAQYPYAQRLDEGWSKQSPKGMTEPTQKFVDREMKRIMGL